jgi:hypothetical protein
MMEAGPKEDSLATLMQLWQVSDSYILFIIRQTRVSLLKDKNTLDYY